MTVNNLCLTGGQFISYLVDSAFVSVSGGTSTELSCFLYVIYVGYCRLAMDAGPRRSPRCHSTGWNHSMAAREPSVRLCWMC